MMKKMIIRDSSGRERTMPIPKHVQVEMAACVALDQLKGALARAEQTLSECSEACQQTAAITDGAQVHAQWANATQRTNDSFARVRTPAQALIDAVRTMLAV